MLEIILTVKILGSPIIGGPRLKPLHTNAKSAPDYTWKREGMSCASIEGLYVCAGDWHSKIWQKSTYF